MLHVSRVHDQNESGNFIEYIITFVWSDVWRHKVVLVDDVWSAGATQSARKHTCTCTLALTCMDALTLTFHHICTHTHTHTHTHTLRLNHVTSAATVLVLGLSCSCKVEVVFAVTSWLSRPLAVVSWTVYSCSLNATTIILVVNWTINQRVYMRVHVCVCVRNSHEGHLVWLFTLWV